MKKKINIIYFSGSGNSFKISSFVKKLIINKFRDKYLIDLVNIDNLYKYYLRGVLDEKFNEILENCLTNIFVFPVYFYRIPKIVYEVFFNLKSELIINRLIAIPSIFIITHGGLPANALYFFIKRFKFKNIAGYFKIHFEDSHPSLRQRFNPFISKGYPTKKEIFLFKKNFVSTIYKSINNNFKSIDIKFNYVYIFVELMSYFYTNKKLFAILNRKFQNDKCINCGLCVLYCPTNALRYDSIENGFKNIYNGKNLKIREIYFNVNKCIGCYRCVNSCPSNAINTNLSSTGLKYKRYINLILR